VRTKIETVKAVLGKIKQQPDLATMLADDTNIIDEVGLDSLEMLQFMLELEEQMAIMIDFERLEYEHLHSIEILAGILDGMPSRVVC